MARGFDHSSQKDAVRFIRENIGRHKQFALGTVDSAGQPWVVCLNLAYDDKLNIIWKSEKSTEHSNHIQNNPTVSICIFSETDEVGDFGFYARAVAREITDEEELRQAIKIRFEDKGKLAPPIEEFIGNSKVRLYKAILSDLWLNDDVHEKIKIDLEKL